MMLYLSRIPLGRGRRRYELSSDVYAAHRFVMGHFPDAGDPRAALGVLWRFEEAEIPRLLVQSLVIPAGDIETKPFDPSVLAAGEEVRFLLVANPSVKRKREGRRNSVRVGIRDEAEQLAWLERRLAGSLAWSRPGAVRARESRRLRGRGGHRVVVDAVTFDGVGRVVDASRLAEAMARGVGPAKAFGCGLLSVARG